MRGPEGAELGDSWVLLAEVSTDNVRAGKAVSLDSQNKTHQPGSLGV